MSRARRPSSLRSARRLPTDRRAAAVAAPPALRAPRDRRRARSRSSARYPAPNTEHGHRRGCGLPGRRVTSGLRSRGGVDQLARARVGPGASRAGCLARHAHFRSRRTGAARPSSRGERATTRPRRVSPQPGGRTRSPARTGDSSSARARSRRLGGRGTRRSASSSARCPGPGTRHSSSCRSSPAFPTWRYTLWRPS